MKKCVFSMDGAFNRNIFRIQKVHESHMKKTKCQNVTKAVTTLRAKMSVGASSVNNNY